MRALPIRDTNSRRNSAFKSEQKTIVLLETCV